MNKTFCKVWISLLGVAFLVLLSFETAEDIKNLWFFLGLMGAALFLIVSNFALMELLKPKDDS